MKKELKIVKEDNIGIDPISSKVIAVNEISDIVTSIPKPIVKKIKTITSDNIEGIPISSSTTDKLLAFDKILEELLNSGWDILHIGHGTSEYRIDCIIASATLMKVE